MTTQTRHPAVLDALDHHLMTCGQIVTDYDLGLDAIQAACRYAVRLARARTSQRPIVASCRLMVDLEEFLQAAARRRAH